MMAALLLAMTMSLGLSAQNVRRQADPEKRIERRVEQLSKQLMLDDKTAARFAPLYKEYVAALRSCRVKPDKELKGDEAAFRAEVDNCERQFAAFLMTEKLSSPGYVPSMNRSVYEFSTLNEYDAVVYRRGCAMYASLTELAGEKKMREAVREYYSRYKYLNATGEDLVSCFEDVMGEKARTVIYSYLNADVKCGFVAA